MPHIKDDEKVAVHASKHIGKVGELCFLFAEAAQRVYEKEPRWSSIHAIARALFLNPYHEEWSHNVILEYAGSFTQQDIKTAAFLALLEFYRIIGASYEDGMIQQNGNCFKGAPIPSLRAGSVIGSLGIETPMTAEELAVIAPPATPEALHEIEACTPNCFPDEGSAVTVPAKRKAGRPKKAVDNVGA